MNSMYNYSNARNKGANVSKTFANDVIAEKNLNLNFTTYPPNGDEAYASQNDVIWI